ncbi:bacteriorhodopsin [Natrarchaeobaculum aegyptiacum]|uniref:Rhodopsin n=1 Tax=Natrarchaeobaculum aegyptiacum TaxID=745377 RepID=A0A2Z2HU86_9EURY|nr:bacteriorhodopsin [Natrarchaeobaculum aegyptiacum]ARS90836.1 rhodopsin [Natrarchaeobaculum aegyptiacum]
MIEHTTLFGLSSGIIGLMAVVFFGWTVRRSSRFRVYGFAVVVACGAMSVAYLLMAAEVLTVTTTGREESVARFFGYTIAWAAVCGVVGAVTDADRRYVIGLLVFVLGCLWGTFASWVLGGLAGTVVSIGIFTSLIAMVYVLFGPLTNSARTVSADRLLLYEKTRNLVILVFAGLLLTGLVSEQNFGLTDAFVGQLAATYIDLVWLAGFGGLVFRYQDALEEAGNGPLGTTTRDDDSSLGESAAGAAN